MEKTVKRIAVSRIFDPQKLDSKTYEATIKETLLFALMDKLMEDGYVQFFSEVEHGGAVYARADMWVAKPPEI